MKHPHSCNKLVTNRIAKLSYSCIINTSTTKHQLRGIEMTYTIIRITYTDLAEEIIVDFTDLNELQDFITFELVERSIPFQVTYA